MKQKIEEAEKEYYEKNYPGVDINRMMVENAFEAGAEWQSKQSPWISVEERLPDNDNEVLCLCVITLNKKDTPYVFCNQYKDGAWQTKMLTKYKIIAWMPIPSFDEILEANRDVLERIKEKGD